MRTRATVRNAPNVVVARVTVVAVAVVIIVAEVAADAVEIVAVAATVVAVVIAINHAKTPAARSPKYPQHQQQNLLPLLSNCRELRPRSYKTMPSERLARSVVLMSSMVTRSMLLNERTIE